MDSASTLAARPATRAAGRSRGPLCALILFATFCWAANIIAGKIAMRDGLGPLALAELRVAGAALVLAALFLGWRGRPRLRLTGREWAHLALAAVFGITLNQLFFISGIGLTSAAHAGLIVALGPVMVLALACAMGLESLTALKCAGGLVALAGVAVLTTGKDSGGATLRGDLVMLAGSAVFAYYTILLKKIADRLDTLTLNLLIFGIGALLMVPFSLHDLSRVPWSALPAETWWCLGFIIVLGTVFSYLIYAFVLATLTATRVAAFNYLQPVIAAGLGVWLLGERMTTGVLAGGTLILVGIYLTEWERGESPEKSLEPGSLVATVNRRVIDRGSFPSGKSPRSGNR